MHTQSKKRYDKQAVEKQNKSRETSSQLYHINAAARCREHMNQRYEWVKRGDVGWLHSYFFWKKLYKWELHFARRFHHAACLPLPG